MPVASVSDCVLAIPESDLRGAPGDGEDWFSSGGIQLGFTQVQFKSCPVISHGSILGCVKAPEKLSAMVKRDVGFPSSAMENDSTEAAPVVTSQPLIQSLRCGTRPTDVAGLIVLVRVHAIEAE